MKTQAIALAALLAVAPPALAGPDVHAGVHVLLPDTPGQVVPILVSGGDAVQGLELNMEIGEGTGGPIIEDANLLGEGMIFGGNNQDYSAGGYIDPWRLYLGTTTAGGTVAADGVLATLTVDTTGLYEGVWTLHLHNAFEGETNFAGVEADLHSGALVVNAPEPTTMLLLAPAAGMLLRRRRVRK